MSHFIGYMNNGICKYLVLVQLKHEHLVETKSFEVLDNYVNNYTFSLNLTKTMKRNEKEKLNDFHIFVSAPTQLHNIKFNSNFS